MIADAATASSFGVMGVKESGDGVEGSVKSRGSKRRESKACRGGRKSKVCGGGRVDGAVD